MGLLIQSLIIFTFIGEVISYKYKTQFYMVRSLIKAEFITAYGACKNACYLLSLLKELGFEQTSPTPVHINNIC